MTLPARDERSAGLDEKERAELEALRDFRQTVAFVDDDGSAVIRPWVDAHRLHGDEPYIGCPFCRDQFISLAAHEAALAAARQVDEAMVERALNAEYGSTSLHDLGDPYFKSIHKDIVRAALLAALTPEPEEKR